MSPEIRSKYCTPSQPIVTQASDGGDVTDKTVATVNDEDKLPTAAKGNDEKTLVNDKPTDNN